MKINQIIVRHKTSNFSDFRIVQTTEMFHWPQVVKVTEMLSGKGLYDV